MQKMVTQQQSTSIDAHENCQIIARTRLCTTFHLIEKERTTTTTGRVELRVLTGRFVCSVDTFLSLPSADPIFVSQAAHIGHSGANFTASILLFAVYVLLAPAFVRIV